MIQVIPLEPKTYQEQVTYELFATKISPIGEGIETITNSGFKAYDVSGLTDVSNDILGTASFDTIRKSISVVVTKNTGTRGHSYWLVGTAVTDLDSEFLLIGKFKIEDGVGPANLT